MAKLYMYMMVSVGLMLLFNIIGLATTTGVLLGKLGILKPADIANIQETSYWTTMIGYIALFATVAGVIVGSLTRGASITGIAASAAGLLVLLVLDLISVVTFANSAANPTGFQSAMGYLVFLIFAPLIVAYLVALFDWVRGFE